MAVSVRRREAARQQMQRWDPFRELQDVQERLGQLVESGWTGGPISDVARLWTPPVDIEETEDAWIIEAELPGVRQEDVHVDVQDNELAITGEIKERERTGILRRRTRKTGEFEFRVTLPGQVDAERIDANLRDGVLTVRIPKPEQARPRRIDVKSGDPGAS
jgi:HSP20 family protein